MVSAEGCHQVLEAMSNNTILTIFSTVIIVIVDSPDLGPPDFTVPEDIGTFEVCLNITSPSSGMPLPQTFNISVSTDEDTATGTPMLMLLLGAVILWNIALIL